MAVRDEDVNRPVIDPRFEIVAEAGSGGMGTVFEAIDHGHGPTGGRRVALKVLASTGDRERFQAEAEILETLEHPGIVEYVCHGVTADGHAYLAMEWLVGESLSKRLERGRLAIPEVLVLGERLASALAHAHAHQVVHRDLKPSNIYLVDGRVDRAKLIDFGVAKSEDRDLTRTGQMVGTPGYMAPEQVRGEKTVDRRADVFALGCVLYEALVGRPPYEGDEVMEVISRLLLEKPARIEEVLPDIPPRIVHLIDAMLVKDQAARLGDIGVARDELATITQLLAAGDLAALRTRSPAVPIAPPEDTTARPSFPLATHSPKTVAERPNARRLTSKTGNRWWIAIAIGGAMIGGAVGAYLVIRTDTQAATTIVTPTEIVKPTVPGPVCKDNLRTGCGKRCKDGDADACFLHAESLLAGKRDDKNLASASAAYHRGCDLGLDRACFVGAQTLVRSGPDLKEADLAYAMAFKGCERNDVPSCRILGDGWRVGGAWYEEDEALAFDQVGRTCELDDVAGCELLHEMIANGEGDHKLRKKAIAIREAACARNVSQACSK